MNLTQEDYYKGCFVVSPLSLVLYIVLHVNLAKGEIGAVIALGVLAFTTLFIGIGLCIAQLNELQNYVNNTVELRTVVMLIILAIQFILYIVFLVV